MSRSSNARAPRVHALDAAQAENKLASGNDNAPSQRPLTALVVAPTLEAGAADIDAIETVRVLAQAGHRAIAISKGGRLEGEVAAAGGAFIRMNAASKNPFALLANAARLWRLIKRERCDVVHAHGRTAAWSAYLAARLARIPLLTSWHKGFREQNVFKRLYNSVMARGERVIAASEQIADLINDRHRAAWRRIAVVPPGIDVERFDPAHVSADRIEAVRRAWGVKPGTRVVLVVGRMLRRKGHHVVIRAVNRLKERGLKDFVCVFVGEDVGRSGYVGELWDLVASSNAADIVRFPGSCKDLPAAYAAATVAVSGAVQPEGTQRAIIEAQAMKLPVVVSDLGAGPELVLSPPTVSEDRMTGLRIPAGDDSALAAALIRMFSTPEQSRRAIGERGRAWVLAHFDRKVVSAQMLAVYADVARLR